MDGLYAEHPVWLIGGYFLLYVLVAALSLPGATLLTLLGGAVFGLVTGTLVVSFASSLGATLAMLVSRTLFRDLVSRRFAGTLSRINAGIDRDGAFYLFSLRLVPVFPFFVINLVMGLTRLPGTAFLLGQPARHVARHAGVRECRPRAGTTGQPARHSVTGVCCQRLPCWRFFRGWRVPCSIVCGRVSFTGAGRSRRSLTAT